MITQPSIPAIWENLHDRLWKYLRARVADPQEADDLLQEVFLRIHTRLGGIRDAAKVEGWIFQIARNAVIDHYRSRRPAEELSERLSQPPPEEPDSAEALAGSMRPLADSLPDPYREAVIRIDLEGEPQADFARKTGISLSGAKSRVQRGRRLIRAMLLECCHFEFDHYGRVIDYWEHCCCCTRNAASK
jgi:RNA polymerase sigma-70 factor, ECF subfamily